MEATNKWAYALGDEENYNGIFFDSKEDALDEAIKTCFIDWLNAHPEYKPNFFTVTDAECIEVQKER